MTHTLRHLHSHFDHGDRKKYQQHLKKLRKETKNDKLRWDHEWVYENLRHTLQGKNFININRDHQIKENVKLHMSTKFHLF